EVDIRVRGEGGEALLGQLRKPIVACLHFSDEHLLGSSAGCIQPVFEALRHQKRQRAPEALGKQRPPRPAQDVFPALDLDRSDDDAFRRGQAVEVLRRHLHRRCAASCPSPFFVDLVKHREPRDHPTRSRRRAAPSASGRARPRDPTAYDLGGGRKEEPVAGCGCYSGDLSGGATLGAETGGGARDGATVGGGTGGRASGGTTVGGGTGGRASGGATVGGGTEGRASGGATLGGGTGGRASGGTTLGAKTGGRASG